MKTLALLAFLSTVSVTAQTKKDTKAPAPRTQPADIVIPEGAVEGADGNFHYTDKQGKKWLYRKTPFGVAKSEDKPAPASAQQQPQEDTLTIATDAGESVHFEKPSPFGTVKWDKKKTELDANEQSIWNRQKKQ